jgi:hypothetical protein
MAPRNVVFTAPFEMDDAQQVRRPAACTPMTHSVQPDQAKISAEEQGQDGLLGELVRASLPCLSASASHRRCAGPPHPGHCHRCRHHRPSGVSPHSLQAGADAGTALAALIARRTHRDARRLAWHSPTSLLTTDPSCACATARLCCCIACVRRRRTRHASLCPCPHTRDTSVRACVPRQNDAKTNEELKKFAGRRTATVMLDIDGVQRLSLWDRRRGTRALRCPLALLTAHTLSPRRERRCDTAGRTVLRPCAGR